jgi:hypothetical protein
MYAAVVARPLKTPADSEVQQRLDLVADVARSLGYVHHTHQLAERANAVAVVVAELADMEQRLQALHLVVLVAGGWCPRCSAELTDPSKSPSGTRHCRSCRVGWTLSEDDGLVRAVDRAWPDNTSTNE